MKTFTGILGIAVVIVLASPASASHICPPRGCADWWGSSQQSSDGVSSANVSVTPETPSGGLFTQIVRGFRLAISDVASRIRRWLGTNPRSDSDDKEIGSTGARTVSGYRSLDIVEIPVKMEIGYFVQ